MSIDSRVQEPQVKILDYSQLEQEVEQTNSVYEETLDKSRFDRFKEWGKKTWVWQYRKKSAETGLILAGVKAPIEVAVLDNVDLVDHGLMTVGLYVAYVGIAGPVLLKLFSNPVRKQEIKVAGTTIPYWLRYGGRQVGVALGALSLKVGLYTQYLDNDFWNAAEAGIGVALGTAAISMLTPVYEQKKRAKQLLMGVATAGMVASYTLIPYLKDTFFDGKIESETIIYENKDEPVEDCIEKRDIEYLLPLQAQRQEKTALYTDYLTS